MTFNPVGVVGAGLMGCAIARHFAASGSDVLVYDSDPAQLSRARQESASAGSIRFVSSMDELAAVGFAIEAVFEDLDVKRQVLAALELQVRDDCIIATNTSSLLVSNLASALRRRERFLGVHFNNPADMNPIVEIIACGETDASSEAAVANWIADTGKHAIRCADTSGFILNRQSLPYINEAARCASLASPGTVDEIATSRLGVGLGPFAVMNLVGLKVMAAASRNLAVLGPGYLPAEALQVQPGHWEINSPDSLSSSTADEIETRLLGAMMFPGRDILKRQLCSRDDLHLICIEALGYARSSPELLETLPATRVDDCIIAYLASH